MSNLVHNERVKLTATWLNGVSGSLMAAGVFTPVVAVLLGGTMFAAPVGLFFFIGGGCAILSAVFHIAGRWVLGRLRP